MGAVLAALVVGFGHAPLSAHTQKAWRPTQMGSAPSIDGALDEAEWEQAAQVEGFRTFVPDYGATMIGDTRVYMGYDEHNLFFASEAFDPDPSQIRASVTARDNIRQDDWVAINLDRSATRSRSTPSTSRRASGGWRWSR